MSGRLLIFLVSTLKGPMGVSIVRVTLVVTVGPMDESIPVPCLLLCGDPESVTQAMAEAVRLGTVHSGSAALTVPG